MKRRYDKERLQEIVLNSKSLAQVIRKLGLVVAGGNYQTVQNKIKLHSIDTSHFTGRSWNVGLKFRPTPPIPIQDLLKENVIYQSNRLKLRLLKEGIKNHVCENCNLSHWLEQHIPLELHHENGDKHDNRLSNLKLLCPNCHAQTDNYRGKAIGLLKRKLLK